MIALVLAVMFMLGSSATALGQDIIDDYKTTVTEDSSTVEGYQTFDMFKALGAAQDTDIIKISVSDITDSSANLKWTSNERYSSYVLLKYNDKTKRYMKVSNLKKRTVKLTNLTFNTKYKYMVKAKDDDTVFGKISFKTEKLTPKIEAKDVSSSSVKLGLSGLAKNSKVTIYRGRDKSSLKKLATLEKGKEYVDKKVKAAKTYYYQIKVEQDVNSSKKTTATSKTIKANTPKSMDLPNVSGRTKTYAYYTAVTVKSSPQYKLLHSDECYTDEETGIRKIGEYYCIALGSYYGTKIGTKYRITLSSGKTFKAILCDQKANRHTDSKHQYAVQNKDIIEFYVQKGKIPKGICGSYGNLDRFKGKVTKIERY